MLTQDTTPHTENAETRKPADRSPRAASPSQRLLTGAQIEREFGIPYRSLYDLYVTGKLPAVRFTEGGRLWFRRADVDKLIEASIERRA